MAKTHEEAHLKLKKSPEKGKKVGNYTGAIAIEIDLVKKINYRNIKDLIASNRLSGLKTIAHNFSSYFVQYWLSVNLKNFSDNRIGFNMKFCFE